MANWQDPRPLFPWSAPPEHQGPRVAPKLRPNVYARLARSAVQSPVAAVLVLLFVLATAATICLLTLRVDFNQQPEMASAGSAQVAVHEFALRFPAADRILRIRLSSDTPNAAAQAARSLAKDLRARDDLADQVLLPELEAAAPALAPYYLDTPELNRRLDQIVAATPYYQLIAAAPTLTGLNGMVATAKGAADAGTAPSGLSNLFDALADAANNLTEGRPAALDGQQATGFAAPPSLPEVTLLVVPADNIPAGFQAEVQRMLDAALLDKPFLSGSIESAGASGQPVAKPTTGRQFVVALFLAILFLVSLLAVGFRNPRSVLLAMLAVVAGNLIALAVTTFLVPTLDSVSAVLPLLMVPGSLAISVCFLQALSRHEKRAISTLSLIMLAAQQSGSVIAAMTGLASLLWLIWALCGGAAAYPLAVAAIVGHLAAAAATLLVLPALAALVPRNKPDFNPADIGGKTMVPAASGIIAVARPWAALTLLALALVSAGLILVYDGVPGSDPATQPMQLQTSNQKAAVERVAALRAQESIGRISWVEDFLPTDVAAKQQALARLASLSLPAAVAAPTPQAEQANQLQQLDEGLRLLANVAGLDAALQASALRLRRSLALLTNAAGGPAEAAARLERVLATGLSGLNPYLAGLARLQPPAVTDLDPALRSLFLAADGTYRIEAWPRPPVPLQDFAAVVQAIDPDATSPLQRIAREASVIRTRVGVAVPLALLAFLGIAFLLFRSLRSAAAFGLAQLVAVLLFAGLSLLTVSGSASAVAAAALAGLAASAMAGLWVMLEGRLPWITPYGFMYGPLAGAAVLLPPLFLGIEEFRAFAVSLLLFLLCLSLTNALVTPQLAAWFAGFNWPKPSVAAANSAASKAVTQLSTRPGSDVKKEP